MDIFHRPLRPRPQEIVMDTEQEQGTFTGSTTHHRGYYAGDFSGRAFPTATQLRALWTLRVPAGVGTPW